MDRKEEDEDMSSTVEKPIKHMTVEFDNPEQEKEFIKYAYGKIPSDDRVREISNMIKNHKRAKPRDNGN
jgi:hypothetical protein